MVVKQVRVRSCRIQVLGEGTKASSLEWLDFSNLRFKRTRKVLALVGEEEEEEGEKKEGEKPTRILHEKRRALLRVSGKAKATNKAPSSLGVRVRKTKARKGEPREPKPPSTPVKKLGQSRRRAAKTTSKPRREAIGGAQGMAAPATPSTQVKRNYASPISEEEEGKEIDQKAIVCQSSSCDEAETSEKPIEGPVTPSTSFPECKAKRPLEQPQPVSPKLEAKRCKRRLDFDSMVSEQMSFVAESEGRTTSGENSARSSALAPDGMGSLSDDPAEGCWPEAMAGDLAKGIKFY